VTERRPPFVIGILARLSSSPAIPLPRLKDRRFVTITRLSFPTFKRHISARCGPLEDATWTGLEDLVDSLAEDATVQVKALDISERELLRDFQRAPELNQTAVYKKAYCELHDTFGGTPLTCMVADYSLTAKSKDHVEILASLSQLAATCWSPLFVELDPDVPDAAPEWLSFRRSNAAAFLFPMPPGASVPSLNEVSCNTAYRIAATIAQAPGGVYNIIPSAQIGTTGPRIALTDIFSLGALTAQFRSQLRIRLKPYGMDVMRFSENKFTWDGSESAPTEAE
jgi:hypothetical protein